MRVGAAGRGVGLSDLVGFGVAAAAAAAAAATCRFLIARESP